MVRWYDALAAILCAYAMMYAFFSIPVIGAFVAYGLYELWMQLYCRWRHEEEYGE